MRGRCRRVSGRADQFAACVVDGPSGCGGAGASSGAGSDKTAGCGVRDRVRAVVRTAQAGGCGHDLAVPAYGLPEVVCCDARDDPGADRRNGLGCVGGVARGRQRLQGPEEGWGVRRATGVARDRPRSRQGGVGGCGSLGVTGPREIRRAACWGGEQAARCLGGRRWNRQGWSRGTLASCQVLVLVLLGHGQEKPFRDGDDHPPRCRRAGVGCVLRGSRHRASPGVTVWLWGKKVGHREGMETAPEGSFVSPPCKSSSV